MKPNFGQMQILGLTREGSLFYGVSTSLRDAFIAPLDLTTGTGLGTPKPVQEERVGATLWPRWSKDGKTVVYVRVGPPGSLRGVTLIIRSLDTGAERELKPDLNFDNRNNIHPSLSPDGRSLLVAAMDRRGRQGIFQVDAQTGDFTLVVRAEPGTTLSYPTWSPNGETIFYRTENPDRTTLVAREAATGKEHKLYEAAAGQFVRNMNLSRDGRHLAFVQIESATRSSTLKVLPIAGGAPRELFRVQEPEAMAGIAAPGWTPDGQYVIVRKFREAKPAPEITLWAIPVAGGKPKPLGPAPSGHMLLLDVHPDGQRIAFTAGEGKAELWVMENFLPQTRAAK